MTVSIFSTSGPSTEDQLKASFFDPIDGTLQYLISEYNKGMNLVWRGTFSIGSSVVGGMTPQEVMNVAGPRALKLIAVAAATRDLINAFAPGTLSTDLPGVMQKDEAGNITEGPIPQTLTVDPTTGLVTVGQGT